jgi:hypothetical protein
MTALVAQDFIIILQKPDKTTKNGALRRRFRLSWVEPLKRSSP